MRDGVRENGGCQFATRENGIGPEAIDCDGQNHERPQGNGGASVTPRRDPARKPTTATGHQWRGSLVFKRSVRSLANPVTLPGPCGIQARELWAEKKEPGRSALRLALLRR